MGMERIVVTGASGGHLAIEYLGAVGLRGGRYRVQVRDVMREQTSYMTTDLVSLRVLRDLLNHEIERAAHGRV